MSADLEHMATSMVTALPGDEQRQKLLVYRREVLAELSGNILPFAQHTVVDREHGGFHSLESVTDAIVPRAPKALVQHARMLWIFGHAARMLGDERYAGVARRAQGELLHWFKDDQHGGYHWMVDFRGRPLDTDKVTYGQAFALYGLAEAHLLSGDRRLLDEAIQLYGTIEQRCADRRYGGYWEAHRRDWAPAPDLWIDESAVPVAKGMNAQLHLLEAYTHLLRAWDDEKLKASLRDLIEILLTRVIHPDTHHLQLHFDRSWRSLSDQISYGHDIEASWLLVEAATVLGEGELLAQVSDAALDMALAVLEQGLDEQGGLWDEGEPSGALRTTKTWWTQAEAMVGFLNAYTMGGDTRFLAASLSTWRYVQSYIIDSERGEWHYSVDASNRPLEHPKSGPWKAAYHNGRACLEVMRLTDLLLSPCVGDEA